MGRKIPDTITEEELIQILKVTKRKHHKLAFLLGFYQCLRISEIVGLGKQYSKCCGVEIGRHREKVDDQKIMIRTCPKCNKRLELTDIRRNPNDLQILPLTKENVVNGFIQLKNAKGGKDRNIPIAPELNRYLGGLPIKIKARALETAIKKQAKAVLGKDLHFHSLRHSGATHYLNKKKWNIRHLQQFLGHSNLNTTQIYTHVSPDDLLKVMMGNEE